MRIDWTLDQVAYWMVIRSEEAFGSTADPFSWSDSILGSFPSTKLDHMGRVAGFELMEPMCVYMDPAQIEGELIEALVEGRLHAHERGRALSQTEFFGARFFDIGADGRLRLLLQGERLHWTGTCLIRPNDDRTHDLHDFRFEAAHVKAAFPAEPPPFAWKADAGNLHYVTDLTAADRDTGTLTYNRPRDHLKQAVAAVLVSNWGPTGLPPNGMTPRMVQDIVEKALKQIEPSAGVSGKTIKRAQEFLAKQEARRGQEQTVLVS